MNVVRSLVDFARRNAPLVVVVFGICHGCAASVEGSSLEEKVVGGETLAGVLPMGVLLEGIIKNGEVVEAKAFGSAVLYDRQDCLVATASHNFYRYLSTDGNIHIPDGKKLFVSFDTTPTPNSSRFEVSRVVHQLPASKTPASVGWHRYANLKSDSVPDDLQKIAGNDLAIVKVCDSGRRLPVDLKEAKLTGGSIGSQSVVVGHGVFGRIRASEGGFLAINGSRHVSRIVSNAEVGHHGILYASSGMQRGPHGGDSGGFTGRVLGQSYMLQGITLTRPSTVTWRFMVRGLDEEAIQWFNAAKNELRSSDAFSLYRPIDDLAGEMFAHEGVATRTPTAIKSGKSLDSWFAQLGVSNRAPALIVRERLESNYLVALDYSSVDLYFRRSLGQDGDHVVLTLMFNSHEAATNFEMQAKQSAQRGELPRCVFDEGYRKVSSASFSVTGLGKVAVQRLQPSNKYQRTTPDGLRVYQSISVCDFGVTL